MPTGRWFRFYDDAMDDPKLDDCTADQCWLWVVLLSFASRSPQRGHLLMADGVPVKVGSIARRARMAPDEVEATMRTFASLGMVALSSDGVWSVTNWDKRQFESDSSTERVRKFRERQEKQQRNVSKTFPQQPETATETPPETDTETDTEAETEKTQTPPDGGAGEPPATLTAQRIVEMWNEICGDVLPRVRELTDKRRQHLKVRCARKERDAVWWEAYFQRIRASPFLTGQEGNGWRADFHWVIKSEDTVVKILEGRYDPRDPPAKTQTPQARQSNVILHRGERKDDAYYEQFVKKAPGGQPP